MDKKNIEELKKSILEVKDKLEQLPPAPKLPKLDTTVKETCICGKVVPISQLKSFYSGAVQCIGDVCKGCEKGEKQDKQFCKLICAKCKRVICRVTPGVDPTDGFEFKAGACLHTAGCGYCSSTVKDGEQEPFPIIEKRLWRKVRKGR